MSIIQRDDQYWIAARVRDDEGDESDMLVNAPAFAEFQRHGAIVRILSEDDADDLLDSIEEQRLDAEVDAAIAFCWKHGLWGLDGRRVTPLGRQVAILLVDQAMGDLA